MLSTLVLFGLLALVLSEESTSTSSSDVDIHQVQVRTSSIGRIKYEDGEVILSQNQQNPTDIFFSPFPRVDPTNTECRENLLSDHVELILSVELYTPKLVGAVDAYLQQRFPKLCGENGTCDVSLLPMNAIRLVQKGLRTNKARQMYTISDEWNSNTLLLQSIEFIIYTSNDSVCEKLRSSIAKRCHISNFEVQYSLHSEKTVERRVEINTEQITGTSMFNQIKSQFPRADTVALTGGDFKQLISEVTDKITMKLRVQEGFDSQIQDPIALNKLLEQQLQFKKVHLEKMGDQRWDSLYWTRDLTRPDRLAKVINTIVRKNATNSKHFVYDSQAARNADKRDLTDHDIDRLEQLDKSLATHSRSSATANAHGDDSQGSGGIGFKGFTIGGGGSKRSYSQSQQSADVQSLNDTMHHNKIDKNHLNVTKIEAHNDTQFALSRDDVENYLSELSNHVHLEGELIRPKPIDAHLIKMSTLRAETKLLSHTVLVHTRSNVHVLPLRCPPKENRESNTTNQNHWLEDKVEQLTNSLSEIKNQMSERIAQVQEQCTNRVSQVEEKWTSKANAFIQLENKITAIEKKMIKRKSSFHCLKTKYVVNANP